MEDIMMTVDDVAKLLKISKRSAHTFVHNKNFNGLLYIGRNARISKNKLLKYIEDKLIYKL